jgi:hypothetical protein
VPSKVTTFFSLVGVTFVKVALLISPDNALVAAICGIRKIDDEIKRENTNNKSVLLFSTEWHLVLMLTLVSKNTREYGNI